MSQKTDLIYFFQFRHPMFPLRSVMVIVDYHHLFPILCESVGGEDELLSLHRVGSYPEVLKKTFLQNCGLRECGFENILNDINPQFRPGDEIESSLIREFLDWYQLNIIDGKDDGFEEDEPKKKRGWPKGKPRKKKEDQGFDLSDSST